MHQLQLVRYVAFNIEYTYREHKYGTRNASDRLTKCRPELELYELTERVPRRSSASVQYIWLDRVAQSTANEKTTRRIYHRGMYVYAHPGMYAGVPARSLAAICDTIGLHMPAADGAGTGVGGRITIDDRIDSIRSHCAQMCHCSTHGSWSFASASPKFVCASMEQRDTTTVRAYQADAVDEFVDTHEGVALSGALWMPCGAGKTLTALLVVERLQTYTLVFVNTTMSGSQWRSQIHRFFHLDEAEILFVESPESLNIHRIVSSRPAIVIMTYAFATMATHASSTTSALALVMSLHYGLVILDEAQTAVATDFRRAMSVSTCTRVAISATFARCDSKLDILPAYIGTKTVSVPLHELVRTKMVAEVRLVDVEVEGDPIVHSPTRVSVAANIIENHQRAGDRVVVFFEEISIMHQMHTFLVSVIGDGVLKPLMGDTVCTQRRHILREFRGATRGIVLFMTTVGDTAVDLPDANIMLQFACGSASHNQELQRIGRIQRIGKDPSSQHIAYTLWHRETGELDRLTERRIRTSADGYASERTGCIAGTRTDPGVHIHLATMAMHPAPIVRLRIPTAKRPAQSSMHRRLAVAMKKNEPPRQLGA